MFSRGMSAENGRIGDIPDIMARPPQEHHSRSEAQVRRAAELPGLLPEAERRLESLRQALTRLNAA